MDCDSGESHLLYIIHGAAGAEGARYTESIFNLSGKRTENKKESWRNVFTAREEFSVSVKHTGRHVSFVITGRSHNDSGFSFISYKKESCSAGFSACGGLPKQHFPFRRSAILAKLFHLIGNKVSYKMKKLLADVSGSLGFTSDSKKYIGRNE